MAPALSDLVLGPTKGNEFSYSPLDATALHVSQSSYTFWIDQVGSYLVSLAELVSIGGPRSGDQVADVALMANLSRRHVSIVRSGERYVLHAHAATQVAGKAVLEKCDLCDGAELQLGHSVRLKFRIPSVVSGSARLEFLSDHRPASSADAVVLMSDTCLMGPSAENHIQCAAWPSSLLLFRKDKELWIKGRDDLFLDGAHAPQGGAIGSGTMVTATDIRFRVERSP